MDSLILEGRIIQKLDPQEGVSARGPWKKQDFIMETEEQFPKKVCISCWGERMDDLAAYAIHDLVRVGVNIESREFNQRWYTDVKAWKFETGKVSKAPKPVENSGQNTEDIIGMSFSSDDDDELPF